MAKIDAYKASILQWASLRNLAPSYIAAAIDYLTGFKPDFSAHSAYGLTAVPKSYLQAAGKTNEEAKNAATAIELFSGYLREDIDAAPAKLKKDAKLYLALIKWRYPASRAIVETTARRLELTQQLSTKPGAWQGAFVTAGATISDSNEWADLVKGIQEKRTKYKPLDSEALPAPAPVTNGAAAGETTFDWGKTALYSAVGIGALFIGYKLLSK